MSKLSRADVLKLAQLSRLKLTEREIDEFVEEFSEIITYVEKLDSVETANLEPTYQVTGLKNVMREDTLGVEPVYNTSPKDLLKNAPDTLNGQFKVKKMVG